MYLMCFAVSLPSVFLLTHSCARWEKVTPHWISVKTHIYIVYQSALSCPNYPIPSSCVI